jgi:hypothetical protein
MITCPLTPLLPELADWKRRAPLVLRGLKPLVIVTSPPVKRSDVDPPDKLRSAPIRPPLWPTEMLILPAFPPLERPVLILIDPEARRSLVPVCSVMPPLEPPGRPPTAAPPGALDSMIEPLVAVLLKPETIEMAPPVPTK